jgi:hypothetical protein
MNHLNRAYWPSYSEREPRAFQDVVTSLNEAVAQEVDQTISKEIAEKQRAVTLEAQDEIRFIPWAIRASVRKLVESETHLDQLENRWLSVKIADAKVCFWRGMGQANLTDAHRILFDYCKAAGLKPVVREIGRLRATGYELHVQVQLSKEKVDQARSAFNHANSERNENAEQ